MSDPDNGSPSQTTGSRPAATTARTSPALRVVVIVLAVIGGIAVLAALAMGWMHVSMMGGMGRC